MIPLRRTFSAAAAVVAIFVVAGCASDTTPGTTRPGVPEGLRIDLMSDSPNGTWIERGESFAIVTMGSSSCPPVATDLRAEGDDHVVVTFGPSPNDPCTADMAPTTHEFELPAGVTRSPVTVNIQYEDWPEVHSFTLE